MDVISNAKIIPLMFRTVISASFFRSFFLETKVQRSFGRPRRTPKQNHDTYVAPPQSAYFRNIKATKTACVLKLNSKLM